MRALLVGALLLAGLASEAAGQLAVGPTAITNKINGIPITVSATSWITVNSVGDDFTVDARIFADLVDLQRKFSNIVDSFRHTADTCANRGGDNQSSVVSLKSGSLWPRGDQLIMFVRGHIDIWSCIVGPQQSKVRWQEKKIAFLKLKVPVLHKWTNMTKNKKGTQPFQGTLPVYLAEKDNAKVALEIAKPDITLQGQGVLATNENLNLAKMDLSQKTYNALQGAIDLAKMKEALPQELQKLDMTVVSARFRNQGGHAIAEINLAAKVPGNRTTLLLQQIAASPGKSN